MSDRPKQFAAAIAAIIALAGVLVAPVYADEFGQSNMRFERLSIDDGLSQSAVMAVTQDDSGFIWFATESGLDRYDGYSFRNYRHERGDLQSLSNNFVRDIAVGDNGEIWVATDGGGVSRWDAATDLFTALRHDPLDDTSIAADRVRRVSYDPRGFLWIGTRESGLDRLEIASGKVAHFSHDLANPESISNDEIYAITVDEGGVVWVGTKNGLNRLDTATGRVQRFQNVDDDPASLGDDHVRALLVDRSGVLWVGTNGGGLQQFDPVTQSFRSYTHNPNSKRTLSSNRVETLFEDDDDRIWVGTDRGLNLLIRQTGAFLNYSSNSNDLTSLSDDFVFSIYQDRGGILWVGTRTGGVNKWNPRSWSFGHYRPRDGLPNSLSNPNVTSFTQDLMGRTWVGTVGGGINIIERESGRASYIRHSDGDDNSLSDDRVMALLTDRDGVIWAGTMRGGLNRIDPVSGNITVFRHDPDDISSLAANGIMALYEDRYGRIWIGTFGGGISRFRFETQDFVNFSHDLGSPGSLSSNRATSIIEDHNGAIWVGTDGGGLNRSKDDGHSWVRFEHQDEDVRSLSANTVYALHVDQNNVVWAGTRNGLDRISTTGDRSTSPQIDGVSISPGIVGSTIYSMIADRDGNLWMGTERGLTQLDPENDTSDTYHSAQGLQGDEFNFGASYVSTSGELFFGGANGFNRFDPRKLQPDTVSPTVVLTSLAVWNETLDTPTPFEQITTIDLGYRDDSVTFEFAALDFEAPTRNRYSYRLVGFDESWVDAGVERRVTYTNLDGGDYTLNVRSASAYGEWSELELSIPLSVSIAPWETWWAYLSYLMLSLAVLFSLYFRQHRRLHEKAEQSRRLEIEVEERTKELNHRHDELREANQQLVLLSTTDTLTGLRNRRYLFEKVTKDVDLVLRRRSNIIRDMDSPQNTDLLFMMVDLDNFKPVNDTYGHKVGDELLVQVCEVLVESCRASDDIIRWGGDEFLIVARDTNPFFAATLAERIRANLAQRVFSVGNRKVARTTASIGYASFPFIKEKPDLLLWEDVLGLADTAMYEAKTKKNAWVGVEGVNWTGDGDALYTRAKQEPAKLADEGNIRIVESIREVELYAGGL